MFTQGAITAIFILSSFFGEGDAHGYLLSPRSRNFIAWQDGVWSGAKDNDYRKEDCPHCANLGGTLARCGLISGRNYDQNLNFFGKPMQANPQVVFSPGEEIEVDVVLTAHHKGHFEFSICPITEGEIPHGDCFANNPLEVVFDPLYGAPQDPNYPQRAYIPPRGYSDIVTDTTAFPGSLHRFVLKLPDNIKGDLVLLQWHYFTANTCAYPGYDTYNFPPDWGNVMSTVAVCDSIPEDGKGAPEQFWNCAEIAISDGNPNPSPTPAPAVVTGSSPVLDPTTAPVPMPSDSPVVSPTPPPVNPTNPPTHTVGPAVRWQEWVLDYENRCGTSEADARGNCHKICSSNTDCGVGEYCWVVHANYCGSKPQPQECKGAAKGDFRCGVSELVARETCGLPCTLDAECNRGAGESCFALNLNFCDCDDNDNLFNRMLRGARGESK